MTPELVMRADLAKVRVGLRTCRNFIVEPHGGVKNRPGTMFVAECKDSILGTDKKVRVIEFEFSTIQTYALEFGNLYMRVYKDGATVLEPTRTIIDTTEDFPVNVQITAHGYTTGDQIFIEGVATATSLNKRHFLITVVNANNFTLDGIDGTGIGVGSGGTAGRVFTLVTPYLEADLFELNYAPSADVLTITHPNYDPRDLTRTDHHVWTLTLVVFQPSIAAPTQFAWTVGAGVTFPFDYQVTSLALGTLEESLPAASDGEKLSANPVPATPSTFNILKWKPPLTGTQLTVTAATEADPAVLTTSVAHGYIEGDRVWLDNFAGGTWAGANGPNDTVQYVNPLTPTTFELRDFDSSALGTYTASSGDCQLSAAAKHNIYKKHGVGELFGFVGQSDTHRWEDSNIAALTSDQPPVPSDPFSGAGNFPGAVAYFQQRKMYGGTDNKPQTLFGSQAGVFDNMNVSVPLRDDDAIEFTIAAKQVNRILHIVPLADLLVLTSGGDWRVFGNQDNIVGPLTLDVRPQGQGRGANRVIPLVIGNSALYVERSGDLVRDLAFDITTEGYKGNDLSVLARHLFEGFTVDDWAFAKAPDSVIWAIRSDGVALGLTYLREHEVWGWSRHDTVDGAFESVCSIPEGNEDAVYFIVKRRIGGVVKRFVERLHTRQFSVAQDAFFVDSGLSLDLPKKISGITKQVVPEITATAHGFAFNDIVDLSEIDTGVDSAGNPVGTVELNGERVKVLGPSTNKFSISDQSGKVTLLTTVTATNPVGIIASAHGFSDGDRIAIAGAVMVELNNRIFTVTNSATNTFDLLGEDGTGRSTGPNAGHCGLAHIDPATLLENDGTTYGTYISGGNARKVETVITNLNHLEGETVAILADGSFEGTKVVASGQITLAIAASRVHIGLGYDCDIETLPLQFQAPRGPSTGIPKVVTQIRAQVRESRGFRGGPSADRLIEAKWPAPDQWGDIRDLVTGQVELIMAPGWTDEGGVFLRQADPLPLTIDGIIFEIQHGD